MTAHNEPSHFRLTVMRVVAELQDKKHGPVRAIEIYSHPALKGEESKRISNTLFNCKNAAKALLVQNVSSEFEVTAAGNAFLAMHMTEALLRKPEMNGKLDIPEFGKLPRIPPTPAERTMAEHAIDPPYLVKHSIVDERAFKPGAIHYVPEEGGHVQRTMNDLEQRAAALEEQASNLRATAAFLRNELLRD